MVEWLVMILTVPRDAAARASVLYFILDDLNKINPMYQFSLKSFSVVFDGAIQRAVMDQNVQVMSV